MIEDKARECAVKAAVGGAAGVITGLGKAAPPLGHGHGTGVMNVAARFCNTATKSLKAHKGLATAVSAGAAAAVGNATVAAIVAPIGPFIAGAAAVGLVGIGIYKSLERWRLRK
jgi:hypothetical protein